MNWQISESISFEEAIKLTQSLLNQIESNQLSEPEIEGIVTSLVQTKNGARGFFVTYLTDERNFADNPSLGIMLALKSAPEIISELLAKNLVMSAAMVLTHRRNQDEEMAKSSEQVRHRVAKLIQQLKLDAISEQLYQLQESLTTGKGNYQDFLERWNYDEQQRQLMQKAISEVVKLSPHQPIDFFSKP
jgi:hypothetical protein